MTTKRQDNLPIKNSNWVQIKFSYSDFIVLPYEQGIHLCDAMRYAETLDKQTSYEAPRIMPYKGDFEMTVLSDTAYKDYKANTLLIDDDKK